MENDSYPPHLATLLPPSTTPTTSTTIGAAVAAAASTEAVSATSTEGASSYGECPLCSNLFPVTSLQVRAPVFAEPVSRKTGSSYVFYKYMIVFSALFVEKLTFLLFSAK